MTIEEIKRRRMAQNSGRTQTSGMTVEDVMKRRGINPEAVKYQATRPLAQPGINIINRVNDQTQKLVDIYSRNAPEPKVTYKAPDTIPDTSVLGGTDENLLLNMAQGGNNESVKYSPQWGSYLKRSVESSKETYSSIPQPSQSQVADPQGWSDFYDKQAKADTSAKDAESKYANWQRDNKVYQTGKIIEPYEKVFDNSDFRDVVNGTDVSQPEFNYRSSDTLDGKIKYLFDSEYQKSIQEKSQEVGQPNIYGNLDYLTGKEKNILKYYYATGDRENAEKYLEALSDSLDQRKSSAEFSGTQAYSEKHPFAGALFNIVSSFASPVGYIATAFGADENSDWFAANRVQAATQQGVGNAAYNAVGGGTWGDIAKFGTDLLLSVGQYASKLPLGAAGALGMMGAGAAGQASYDALRRGASRWEAFGLGTLNGAIETLTEKLPLDNLFKLGGDGIKITVKDILKQSGIEASEEMIAEIAGNISDMAIMGQSSEYNQYIDSLMADGASRSDAEGEAFMNFFVWNTLKAGASGALSGGLMAGAKAGGVAISDMVNGQQNAPKIAPQNTTFPTPSVDTAKAVQISAQAGTSLHSTNMQPAANVVTPRMVETAKSALGINGQKALTTVLQTRGDVPFTDFQTDFYHAYNAGRNGKSLDSAKVAVMSQPQALNAYYSGQNDAELYSKGGIIRDATYKKAKLTSGTEMAIDALGKIAGKTVTFVDRIADANGNEANASINGNEIRIALNGDNPALTSMVHEVVHGIKAADETAYNTLRDFVTSAMSDPETSIAARMATYKTSDTGFATEEMIADALGFTLGDSALLGRFVQDNRSTARKIFDALNDFITKLRRRMNDSKLNMSKRQRAEFEELDKRLSDVLDAFETAVKGSETRAAEVEQTDAAASGKVKYALNPMYTAQVDYWDRKKRPEKTFHIGLTSDALKSIGIENRGIVWHSRKIENILNIHPEMTLDIIKQVPNILENPIVVLKSKNHGSRIVLFGEVIDSDGDPVVTVLELQPTSEGGQLIDLNVVASAYGKSSNIAGFIETGELLYLDPNKNRTNAWLQGLGLQLPSDATSYAYGSIGRVSYLDGNVNISGVPYKQYMQNSSNNSSVTRHSLKDSQGNTLTEAQAEFFKDSKVRDEDGNLQVVYHGTAAYSEITTFRRGTKGWLGGGIYLTSEKNAAQKYADKMGEGNGRVYVAYANITNPLFVTQGNPVPEILKAAYGRDSVYKNRSAKQGNDASIITRSDINKLEDLGYDGIAWKFGGSVEVSAFSPEQIKSTDNQNPTDNPDIRFSRKGVSSEIEQARQEIAALKTQNERLKAQFKRSEGVKTKPAAVEKYVRQLVNEYDSEYSGDLAGRIQSLYDFIANGTDAQGNELTFEQVKSQAAEIARDILENSETLNDEAYKDFAELRKYLKDQKISISDTNKNDLPGGFATFRKKNFGKFNLTKDGTPIETIYQEFADQYPGIFDEEVNPHPADQLVQIAEFLDSIKPVLENQYADDMENATEYLANDIIEQFYEIPEQGPTFADKQAQRRAQMVIENTKRLQRVRTQRDEKIAKVIDKYTVRENTTKERYNARELRSRIKKTVDRLSKRVLNPTTTNHVPDALVGPVAEFLGSVNLAPSFDKQGKPKGSLNTYNKLMSMKSAYEKLAKGELEGADKNIALDGDLQGNMLDIAEVMKTKSVSEMDLNELQTLYEVVAAVEKSIVHYNKAFNANIKKINAVLSQEVMRENETDTGYTGSANALARISANLVNAELLSPTEFFDDTGETLNAMYGYLRDGLDKKVANISIAQEYMKNLIGNTDIKTWTGDDATQTAFDVMGGKITLTPSQVMGLYLLQKQEKAKNHIFKGGIKQGETIVKNGKRRKISKSFEPVKVNDIDVAKILSTLTDEQKRIADGIGKFFADYTAKWGNEVSLILYGYKKFTEDNYYTITSDPNYISTDIETPTEATLINMGITKSRLPKATNPIMVFDCFDVFTKQADKMSSYNAFVVPLADFQNVWNYKSKDGSVKQAIEKKLGERANRYIKKFLIDVNGGIRTSSGSAFAELMTGKYKAASLGLNLRVIAQQPTSYLRAASLIDPKYLIKGAAQNGNWDEVREHVPIAKWRDMGYYSLDVGRQMKDVFVGKPSMTENFMSLIGAADRLAWSRIWNAVKLEIADTNPNLQIGTEEFYKAATRRFNEVVDRTQVIDTVFHRTQFAREKDFFSKITTSYMSEPMKQFNMLRSAYLDIKSGTPEGKQKGTRKIASVLSSMALNAIIVSVIDAIRDDDDEKFLQKFANALFGKKILEGNFIEQFTGMIPYVKDIFSLVKGYDVEPLYFKGFEQAISAYTSFEKYITAIVNGERPTKTPYIILRDIASAIGTFTGLPIKNVFRELESFSGFMLNVTGDNITTYARMKLFYNVQSTKNRARYVRYLYNVRENGSKEDYLAITIDLIRNGMSRDYLIEQMRKIVKGTDEFKAKSADIRADVQADLDNSKLYAKIPDEYQEYIDKSLTLYANADALLQYEPRPETREKLKEIEKQIKEYEDKLDTLKPGSEEAAVVETQILILQASAGYERSKWIRAADSGEKYDISPADYILFRTALQMADDKNNGNNSISEEEIMAALRYMGKNGYSGEQLDGLLALYEAKG